MSSFSRSLLLQLRLLVFTSPRPPADFGKNRTADLAVLA
jgi:hypothetical protein